MSKRKRKNHQINQAAAAQMPLGTYLNADAAGIDVGAQEFVVAVPHGRGGEEKDVRTFSSFTEGIHAMRDWLLSCKITTVAMEPSGARQPKGGAFARRAAPAGAGKAPATTGCARARRWRMRGSKSAS